LLVAGIANNLRQVKRSFNKKKFIKKTGVKPFVKYVNQNHVIPTRFLVNDFDLKEVKDDNLKTAESRVQLKKAIKKSFSESYRNLPNPKDNEKAFHIRFFFSRLRF
jgi:large subunit ribosomal protein L27e